MENEYKLELQTHIWKIIVVRYNFNRAVNI